MASLNSRAVPRHALIRGTPRRGLQKMRRLKGFLEKGIFSRMPDMGFSGGTTNIEKGEWNLKRVFGTLKSSFGT